MEHATPLTQKTEIPGIKNPGGALLYHLTRIMGLRHLLSPIHFPVRTIEMQLQAIESGKFKRRQIKKLRALLHLMRSEMDPASFEKYNVGLRNSSRRLSRARDAED